MQDDTQLELYNKNCNQKFFPNEVCCENIKAEGQRGIFYRGK